MSEAEFFALKDEFLELEVDIKRAGNKTRLVRVAVIKVREVSQPNALVPPKPLKQKITKPAMSTKLV